jgi:hypothetical protein
MEVPHQTAVCGGLRTDRHHIVMVKVAITGFVGTVEEDTAQKLATGGSPPIEVQCGAKLESLAPAAASHNDFNNRSSEYRYASVRVRRRGTRHHREPSPTSRLRCAARR